ncbi:MAG: hypothetical protein K5873_03985 [Treponema sp.]|nr:hypothetical protein [Treponema sp.]
MKITKFTGAALALTAALALFFTGCSNDEDSSAEIELEADLEIAALNVLRGLCQLPTDEDATNSEEYKGNGVEYLPENWKTSTFTCDQGYVLGDDSTVVSMAASSSDDAAEFVAGLVGESIGSDSYTWNMDGLGSLKFNKVNNDENLYATLDVSIDQIPGLRQINFVPWEVIAAESPSNSFYGVPYFSAGDIIKRISDGTIWMCVRPAGGEWHHKDKSYWICLQPKKINGSCLFSETKKTVKDTTWTYAKSLVDFRIAKEAAHTILYLALYANDNMPDKDDIKLNLDKLISNKGIALAYGSPKKDSNRKGHTDSVYTQPILLTYVDDASLNKTMFMFTKYSTDIVNRWGRTDVTDEVASTRKTKFGSLKKELLSATDSYDESFLKNMGINASRGTYRYYDYRHTWDIVSSIAFENPDRCTHTPTGCNVIFTPQLMIKDNKGKKNGDAVKPVEDNAYKILWRQTSAVDEDDNQPFDYWDSLRGIHRYVDGDEVNLKKDTNN